MTPAMFRDGLGRFGFPRREQGSGGGEGPATKCKGCGEILIKKALRENLDVCPHCHFHLQISARDRIAMLLDPESFEEHDRNLLSVDVLGFTGKANYMSKLEKAWKQTGESSAMISGTGAVGEHPVAFAASDCFFMQGSMGSVLGEKFVRMAEHALDEGIPFVTVSGTGGGARMQEGLFSLMQMAKTSAALARLRDAGLPYISIVTMYTMAGVWASWASLGDVVIAEPGAQIGFTGARVIRETIRQELPDGFQSAEFLLEHGQIDMIVERTALRERLIGVLDAMRGVPASRAERSAEATTESETADAGV